VRRVYHEDRRPSERGRRAAVADSSAWITVKGNRPVVALNIYFAITLPELYVTMCSNR